MCVLRVFCVAPLSFRAPMMKRKLSAKRKSTDAPFDDSVSTEDSLKRSRNQRDPNILVNKSSNVTNNRSALSTIIGSTESSEQEKRILLDTINLSRIDESFSTACGNAFTLLIKLGHSFIGSDLSNIHCSGAKFDSADFRDVNFKGSVFRDCSWDGCCLDGCDFEDCDFTNSNLIEERSSLRDDSQIASLLNLNTKDVVISTTSEKTSIWSEGSIVNRLTDMKHSKIYSSPNEKWLLVSGGKKGYLFETNTLKDIHLVIQDLHCVRDAIALTDDGLYYGVKSGQSTSVDVFYISWSNPTNKLKVNPKRMIDLMGLKVFDPAQLFVYSKDEYARATCSLYQFISETNDFQPLSSIYMTLNRFERIPCSPSLFCWSGNRVPFILHVTSAITHCGADLPFPLQAHDFSLSPDGSSMLLSSTSDGYLFSLMQGSASLTFTKLLEVPGMTGPFSPSQFSSDGQFVSLVCGSEIRVIRVKGCVCLQVICLNDQLQRVSFHQNSQELLIVKKNLIIRRRLNLKEELCIESCPSLSDSMKEISCLGSKFFGATGLSS
jgi:uncharacterized protein YjbI with pentapeptide repeats